MPAKINLALKVGGRRDDGYHPLATVYHAVSLYDEVEAVWAEADEFDVQVSGEGADQVPLDDSNLALRAARLLAREDYQRKLAWAIFVGIAHYFAETGRPGLRP